MSVPIADLMTRAGTLASRYSKYIDPEDEKKKNDKTADPFLELVRSMEFTMEAMREKAEEATTEKNRAAVATLNAEIRRGKNSLRDELPRLKKLAGKKIKALKDASPEEMEAGKEQRREQVAMIEAAIDEIPDGVHTQRRDKGKRPVPHVEISIDAITGDPVQGGSGVSAGQQLGLDMEHTEQSLAFREEFEEAKRRQDVGLDEISKGLGVLKNIAGQMDEEITRQQPLINEMEIKTDKANAELRTANAKLKVLVTNLRSSRNMCIDLTCIVILLSIGLYIYNLMM
mmetsp:Transcript_7729/g.27161  ORF Transcript_7729/g.27161 Transcript_7729/m.27161 type:complete len:286 (-) Transcript_7729:148-1005(-)